MVDFSFFRARSFLGANLVAFIVTFSMLAMFFFLALYMQNVRTTRPLEAGVRFLPSTLVIIVMGPIAGRLSDRIGPRLPMVAGLLLVSGSLFWQSLHHDATRRYGFLLGAFILMGLGMGLVMSPMSTAAMNAVERTKAGVASGVLSMSRMVGGTFGVAVLGALITARGPLPSSTSCCRPCRPARARQLAAGLGAGGGAGAPRPVADAVHDAFVHALQRRAAPRRRRRPGRRAAGGRPDHRRARRADAVPARRRRRVDRRRGRAEGAGRRDGLSA